MAMRSLLPSLWDDRGRSFEPFGSLHREIDRLFDNFSRGFMAPEERSGNGFVALTPRVDVSESDGAIEITAELPGVDEKDVEVTLNDDLLTIKGEKKAEKEDKRKDYHLVERSYGSFKRTMRVPPGTDPDKVTAKFANGVLTVTLEKTPEIASKSKRIEIGTA